MNSSQRRTISLRPKVEEPRAVEALQSIDQLWDELFPAEQARILHTLVERITVRKDRITIKWQAEGLNNLLRDTLGLGANSKAA